MLLGSYAILLRMNSIIYIHTYIYVYIHSDVMNAIRSSILLIATIWLCGNMPALDGQWRISRIVMLVLEPLKCSTSARQGA